MRAEELLPAESRPAPGALRFVQAFVNTLNVERGADAIAEPRALEEWLKRHTGLDPAARLYARDVETAARFREALRVLLTRGHERDPDALAVLDEVGAAGHLRLRSTVAGRLELAPVGSDLWAALAELLVVVLAAMADGTWERLKVCASDDCRWVFYDASKNRSACWCSMETCGNRSKVREHRARRRAVTA